jgi:hypothetical protein
VGPHTKTHHHTFPFARFWATAHIPTSSEFHRSETTYHGKHGRYARGRGPAIRLPMNTQSVPIATNSTCRGVRRKRPEDVGYERRSSETLKTPRLGQDTSCTSTRTSTAMLPPNMSPATTYTYLEPSNHSRPQSSPHTITSKTPQAQTIAYPRIRHLPWSLISALGYAGLVSGSALG